MKEIILGSQSPRRKEILSHFTIPFKQVTPPFCEEDVIYRDDPKEYALEIARGKGESLVKDYKDQLILTADTVVWKNGEIFGKPKDEEDAFTILSKLVGTWHTVFTGVSVIYGEKRCSAVEETKVLFNPMTESEIRHYQRVVHCCDKAGAYAIQLPGGQIVQKIDGCYYNVMGLPINTVRRLMLEMGVDLYSC